MTLYELVLFAHSYLRWVVLAGLLTCTLRSLWGWRRGGAWTRLDEKSHGAVGAFFSDPLGSMKVASLRFFGMEHALGMLFAVAALHIGRTRVLRADTGKLKHRRLCLSGVIGLLLMWASIPWPSRAAGRPMFRGFGAPAPSASAARAAPANACPPVYQSRCASCHGESGRGDGAIAASLSPRPRDLSAPNFSRYRTDEALRRVIVGGGAEVDLSPVMPSHRDLSADEVTALVRCVRSFDRAAAPSER